MCESPITIINKETGEKQKVKCGKCILCRRKKCRNWAIRLYHESQYYSKMCMITLTFRPKFLLRPKIKTLTKTVQKKQKDGTKKRYYIKYNTMIAPNYIKDVKKTGWLVTLFIKKLRKKLSEKNIFISYFAVGEHGSQNTHRAHWHILFFGIDKQMLNCVCIGKSKKNKDIYFSPIIDNLWSYDNYKIGSHTISDVTQSTIKYVANYTMKKLYEANTEMPTTMRFSNQNKIGIKWARRYHKELRKGYLLDNENQKYNIPEGYYKEMLRFKDGFNESMLDTAIEIENNKIDSINKLLEKGLLSEEETKKKAIKYKNRNKNIERDVF